MLPMLMGPPGSGKGTQADLLAQRFKLPRVSGGDLIRAAAKSDGQIGSTIDAIIRAGGIYTGPLASQLVAERLRARDCSRGAVLDGCARTPEQAVRLDALLAEIGARIDHVIALQVPDHVTMRRLSTRWTNRYTGAPLDSAVADETFAYRRPDDVPDVIRKRQGVYREMTAPALEHYERQGKLTSIDGDRPVSAVHEEIVRILKDVAGFAETR